MRCISALCAARSLAYLLDMSALAALLRLELHPHLRVLQRSRPANIHSVPPAYRINDDDGRYIV
ncbi:lipoprotein signal peptidase [Neisseria dentiae]|uniref:lipoprotein signal peptidase n=1 Tax=Neisseria dentiae TaxID=194197 RepID=UPI00211C36DF|nr:lipoprotein signal peptidase [Neisseria dentiae]MCQ9326594.1 lipoprotein signal peptidase [Neisseria dentiae]